MALLQSLIGQLLGGSSTVKRNKEFGLDEEGNPIEGQMPYEDPNFVTKLFFPNVANYEAEQNASYSNEPTVAARKHNIDKSIWGKIAGEVQPYIGTDVSQLPSNVMGLMTRGDVSPTNIKAQQQAQSINRNPGLFDSITKGKLLGSLLTNIGLQSDIDNSIPTIESANKRSNLLYDLAKTAGMGKILPKFLSNAEGELDSSMQERPYTTAARIAEAKSSSLLAPLQAQAAANRFNDEIANAADLSSTYGNTVKDELNRSKIRKSLSGANVDDLTHLLTTQHNQNVLGAAESQFGSAVPSVSTRITPKGVVSGINPEYVDPEIAKLQPLMKNGLIGGKNTPAKSLIGPDGKKITPPSDIYKSSNLIYPINGGKVSPMVSPMVPTSASPSDINMSTKDRFIGLFDSVPREKKLELLEAVSGYMNDYMPANAFRIGGSTISRTPSNEEYMQQLEKLPPEVQENILARALHKVANKSRLIEKMGGKK